MDIFDKVPAMVMAIKSALQSLGVAAINALTPPRCALSGEPVAFHRGLSGPCWAQLQFIDAPYCARCGVAFSIDYGDGMLCPACIAQPPDFDRARAAIVYNDAGHRLVVGFKHTDRTENADMFGAWMARAGRDLLTPSTILAPAPLHRTRLWTRRYNQSALLAQSIAKQTGALFQPDLIRRVRATPPQKELTAKARVRNVAGAFRVPEQNKAKLRGAHIVLVDDVLTTGATLSACARALKRAGADVVDALVLARVVKGAVGAI
ncbi:MAG: ComF family protein [Pseudomonadota bacterium]